MIERAKKTWSRFLEGYALTPVEKRDYDECMDENRDNVEAIRGGYSAASRKWRTPEIPDFLERIRRGIKHLSNR